MSRYVGLKSGSSRDGDGDGDGDNASGPPHPPFDEDFVRSCYATDRSGVKVCDKHELPPSYQRSK